MSAICLPHVMTQRENTTAPVMMGLMEMDLTAQV